MNNKYKITLKHDNGTVTIGSSGSSRDVAIKKVLDSEFAPMSSVTLVEKCGPVGSFERIWTETVDVFGKDAYKGCCQLGNKIEKTMFEYVSIGEALHEAGLMLDNLKSLSKHPNSQF